MSWIILALSAPVVLAITGLCARGFLHGLRRDDGAQQQDSSDESGAGT